MTTRAWLTGELGSAAAFAVPTLFLTIMGAQHVAFYGESSVLYFLSMIWFWGPAPLLVGAALLQARGASSRVGWGMSVVAAVTMSLWSAFVLRSFSRQGDVHWSLWLMWIAGAAGAAFTAAAVFALVPSRRLRSDAQLVGR